MTIVPIDRVDGGQDHHWDVVQTAARNIVRTANECARGLLPYYQRQAMHIVRVAESIKALNREHLRNGYNRAADDGILTLVDDIGRRIMDPEFTVAVHWGFINLMKRSVHEIRGAVYARQATADQQKPAKQFPFANAS